MSYASLVNKLLKILFNFDIKNFEFNVFEERGN